MLIGRKSDPTALKEKKSPKKLKTESKKQVEKKKDKEAGNSYLISR